ncbi:histone acetyltransferase, putative [Phytophthora infestans T30-4]|uniref:histone acetyltransferase n=1 Tax=Phytophthora infestans (strain T30-4) TaxID=403677 RepID=D0NXJ5_PHYIT|nr:histone acetyltransferase, putative [Phytophthora infestans T30-4]EEY67795.1 histone acetyltransferase, putative [Phytophthora infestans T30-4]|eukprot:XP_002997957.1 histone acetyltransferase, putative [Phytophthora infestans T30-4]
MAPAPMGLNDTRALSCEGGKSPAAFELQASEQLAPTLEPSGGSLATPAPANATMTPHGVKRALGATPTFVLSDKKLKLEVKERELCVQETEDGNAEAVVIRRQRRLAVRSGSRSAALSPLNSASAEQIRQHLRDVRRELFLRPLLAIVSKLMFHKGNHGFFNVRVDPEVWNIPHYFEVVKHPMDLAIVKNKCLNLEYATADECADAIRLVFNNACLFNPPGHIVHESAAMLLKEFEADYAKYKAKAEAMTKRRDEHSCPFCLDNVCGMCNEKCINFEPPFVMCSGACRQRIKRHAVYYKTPDGQYHWCSKCFTSLPKELTIKVLPSTITDHEHPTPSTDNTLSKFALLKAKFMDELTEPWVQCDQCSGWVHQICALFNACENADEEEEVMYTCPLCRLEELDAEEKNNELGMSPMETSVEDFPVKVGKDLLGSHSPALKRRPFTKDFTRALGFDEQIEEKVFDYLTRVDLDAVDASTASSFVTSQNLQSCGVSRFMQKWVQQHLENLGEHEAAQSIVVKVVSSIKSSCHVSSVVRENFRSASQEFPQTIDYTSKVIFVFQMINGVEVCIFSMYVQEYDKYCQVPVNRNRTYIAYLDSLVYMRPRHVRTSLYHQILISYLASCKAKGYEYAHIWACPTTRGGDFIYWCHPSFQKNPGKERLLQWYLIMAKKAKELGVVFACDDLYKHGFELLEETLDTQLPPYFDGDYWPSEAERVAASPPKRGRKEANTAGVSSAKFRKKVSESVKSACESLFVIALQPTCAACKQLIVNAAYWRAINVDAYYCSKCQGAVAEAIAPASGQKAVLTKVAPANFAEACSNSKTEELEMSCPFLDCRPNMLKNCEEHHYQFDSFRRAKYSTMMLVYQIFSTQRSA